ncbi:hypothetical protein LY90DRAFT_671541 [Neocallimastix californiae]|uniref:Uncharacterized protein n=1 Tax=Neocallimastix californiae TaxID=1754190 RepID=A0A1Y2CEV7_9FUNG|nr:hypothetical protein LY90DRAFT_671541 [Neocallimastix californiae]|eukprot:ORY45427.1 hypothetical protein LY90DRAFT_671541 [Neocallimastix californiae]
MMDEEVSSFALTVVFPLIFWFAVLYFVLSMLYVVYYFFIRKNYRYIEDHTKEEECIYCSEANCSKRHISIPIDYISPGTIYNEKIKIKSNLEVIEDHMYNLKLNDIEDINDSTLSQENDLKTITDNSHKSIKSYMSNISNITYVNKDDEKSYNSRSNKSINKSVKSDNKSEAKLLYKSINKSMKKLYGSSDGSLDLLNYKYGSYKKEKKKYIYDGKIKNNKVMDADKYIHKSISKNNNKQVQNYISFNKVFKECCHCNCECHNKEYTKVRVKFKTFDLISKNNHEFIYWSFFICLEINTIMIILFGLFSVFPE